MSIALHPMTPISNLNCQIPEDCDVHVVGHDKQVAVVHQLGRDRLGAGSDVQEYGAIFGDLCGAGPRHGDLAASVQASALLVADVDGARGQDRAAMYPFQPPGFGQIGQIPANRL